MKFPFDYYRERFSQQLQDYLNRLLKHTPVAIILWIIVVTLIPHNSQFRFLYLLAHYALLPLFLGIHIFARLLKPKVYPPIRLSWPDLSMAIYIFFVFFSFFWAEVKPGGFIPYTIAIYREVVVPFVAFWLIRLSQPDEKQLKVWVPVMALLCALNSIVSVSAWFDHGMLPSLWPGFVRAAGGVRITGTFSEADVHSGALFFFSTFLLQDAMSRGEGGFRFFFISLFSISLVDIFLSFSRASWLALILVLIIGAFLYIRLMLPLDWVALLVGGALLITVLSHDPGYVLKRLSTVETISNRTIIGYAGTKTFIEKPFIGWGYGSYNLHTRKFIAPVGKFKPTDWDRTQGSSHNTYITILAETGLTGLLLYIFPMLWWVIRTIQIWPQCKKNISTKKFLNGRFLIMLWADLGFIMVISQFIDIHFDPFSMVQLWLILGLISNIVEDFASNESLRIVKTV